MAIFKWLKQTASSNRSVKKHAQYKQHQQEVAGLGCTFCDHTIVDAPQPTETFEHFYTLENMFSYDIWDGSSVAEHMMLIPIQHVTSLSELPKEAVDEFSRLVVDFEAKGYSFYGRSPENATKSIAHQHTHLIKLGKRKRWWIYSRRPAIFIAK